MNEAEWLAADADALRRHALEVGSERKVRLLGVAVVNRIRHLFPGPALVAAVDAAERFADGEIAADELARVQARLHPLSQFGRARAQPVRAAVELARTAGFHECFALAALAEQLDASDRLKLPFAEARAARERAWAPLVRDVFGNPFRPIPFVPEWRTGTATALARGMYEARDFAATPILADALQDAGCENADVLDHCRDPQQAHVRGCWVIDLVLGKA